MSSELSVIENGAIVEQEVFDIIRDLHEKVSMEDTPKTFVKKKMGMDYVEISYMKSIADKYYPGWSWTIVSTEMLGSEAFEGGIWREGDMTAAHRIMKLRDKEGFVDVGNDIKSANTDAMKKAFNMYMNIADDVYRNRVEDTSLSQEDIDYIYEEMEGISDEWKEKISLSVENGDIEKNDIAKVINKINQIKESENE